MGHSFGIHKSHVFVTLHLSKLPPKIKRVSVSFEVTTNLSESKLKKSTKQIVDYKSTDCTLRLDKKETQSLLTLATKAYYQSHSLSRSLFQIVFNVKISKIWCRDFMSSPHNLTLIKPNKASPKTTKSPKKTNTKKSDSKNIKKAKRKHQGNNKRKKKNQRR